jgi:hypothetical protein
LRVKNGRLSKASHTFQPKDSRAVVRNAN